MQNISRIRNIVTVILLISIFFSIIIFIYLYNNIMDNNLGEIHIKLIYGAFAFFIVNIIISGSLMIYIYNNLTKWNFENLKVQESLTEYKDLVKKLESEKKETLDKENSIKISHEDFLKKFSNCKNLKELASDVFKEISKNIQITSALFYIKYKNTEEFIPFSSFALLIDEISSFNIGVGLNGQVAKNKKEVILSSLDEKYFNIVSGLGTSQPSNLAIFPVIIDDNVEGVVEISSFIPLTKNEIQFFINLFSGLSNFKNI